MIELCEATEDNPFIHGMSKQFVKALQQLFDVMDTGQSGTIKFIDLANQWEEDDGDPFFPKGLISCLAKVQLPNGFLTFDRFCAGIKLCLLKNQIDIKDIQKNIAPEEILVTTPTLNSPFNGSSSLTVSNRPLVNNVGNSIIDRPSSEPQMFAPPPPPSLINHHINHLNDEVNNNIIFNNQKNPLQAPPPLSPATISSFNNSTISSLAPDESATSKPLSCSKKLPLPSYEQVMAAKSKPIPKLPHEIFEESIIMAKNNLKPVHHRPYEDRKAANQSSSSFENQYGTNNNCNTLSQQSSSHAKTMVPPMKPPLIHHANACRAKSMSHLDYMPSDAIIGGNEINVRKISDQKVINHQPTVSMETTNGCQKSIDVKPPLLTSPATTTVGAHTTPVTSSSTTMATVSQQPKTVSRNCIMKTLQNWRDNILNRQQFHDIRNDLRDLKGINPSSVVVNNSTTNAAIDEESAVINNDVASVNSSSLRRSSIRRREPRRHTVGANGIDLYAVKRFHQLEQEKDILIRGLNEVEKTKEWYIRQISSIQDKINFAGRCGTFPSDCNIDAYQERINFQAVRIQTLNQHLISLREAGQSFPIHMNLAIRPLNGIVRVDPNQPKQLVVNPNLVNKLKEQNRLLTDEVTRKSERITQLEREKSSLIRELFQARTYSSYYNGHFDDTFM